MGAEREFADDARGQRYLWRVSELREGFRAGLESVETITTLLQRVRNAHPTSGLYEAAEFQWWWGVERATDTLDQLFWFDKHDQPAAAVIATDFSARGSAVYAEPVLVVSVLPDASPDWIAHVVDRGLAHAAEHGMTSVELEVDRADHVMRDLLFGRSFAVKDDGLIDCWLDASNRPPVSDLHDNYRLASRVDTVGSPHHMTDPRRPNIEPRLQQTSLYRPDLDLVVLDADDNPAGYGMFWHDPVSATGIVEPMRTHDDHQQRGLARHILTSGIDRLAQAGAERISIGFEPENVAQVRCMKASGSCPTAKPTWSATDWR